MLPALLSPIGPDGWGLSSARAFQEKPGPCLQLPQCQSPCEAVCLPGSAPRCCRAEKPLAFSGRRRRGSGYAGGADSGIATGIGSGTMGEGAVGCGESRRMRGQRVVGDFILTLGILYCSRRCLFVHPWARALRTSQSALFILSRSARRLSDASFAVRQSTISRLFRIHHYCACMWSVCLPVYVATVV